MSVDHILVQGKMNKLAALAPNMAKKHVRLEEILPEDIFQKYFGPGFLAMFVV